MAAPDRYEEVIECDKCGEKGVIGLSENDYPFMTKLNLEIDYVKGNFSAHTTGDASYVAICNKCGNRIKR